MPHRNICIQPSAKSKLGSMILESFSETPSKLFTALSQSNDLVREKWENSIKKRCDGHHSPSRGTTHCIGAWWVFLLLLRVIFCTVYQTIQILLFVAVPYSLEYQTNSTVKMWRKIMKNLSYDQMFCSCFKVEKPVLWISKYETLVHQSVKCISSLSRNETPRICF